MTVTSYYASYFMFDQRFNGSRQHVVGELTVGALRNDTMYYQSLLSFSELLSVDNNVGLHHAKRRMMNNVHESYVFWRTSSQIDLDPRKISKPSSSSAWSSVGPHTRVSNIILKVFCSSSFWVISGLCLCLSGNWFYSIPEKVKVC